MSGGIQPVIASQLSNWGRQWRSPSDNSSLAPWLDCWACLDLTVTPRSTWCGDSKFPPWQQSEFFLSILRMNLDWYPTISTTYSSSVGPKILTMDLFEQTVSSHSSLSCKSFVCSAWITPDTGGRTKTGGIGNILEIEESKFGNPCLTKYGHLQSICC